MASPTKKEDPRHLPPQHATIGVAEHDAHGPAAFPPFDKSTFVPQLIWLALTFGFLYYMLSKRLLPRMAHVIEDRAGAIRSDLAQAEQLKIETEASLKAYEQALAVATANAAGIAKTQRDALAVQSEKERSAIDAQMAAKVADAEKRIEASKATALLAVSDVAKGVAGDIVAKLTGRSVSDDEIARAIAAVKVK